MTPEERQRAGSVIRERIRELGKTIPTLARDADMDPTTLRAIIAGRTWPREDTRRRLNDALGWAPGEIARRALGAECDLATITTADLVGELCERVKTGRV